MRFLNSMKNLKKSIRSFEKRELKKYFEGNIIQHFLIKEIIKGPMEKESLRGSGLIIDQKLYVRKKRP